MRLKKGLSFFRYSVQATANVAGREIATDRVGFNMPAYGQEKSPAVTPDAGAIQLAVSTHAL